MNNVAKKAFQSIFSRCAAALGIDPLKMYREMPSSSRVGLFALLELTEQAEQLAPPAPTDPRLDVLLQLAAEEEGVPVVLLQSLSWTVARYGAQQMIAECDGPMALPAALCATTSLRDQVLGAARMLRESTERGGTARALLDYTGSRELAAAVASNAALLLLASAPLPPGTTAQLRALLEE